MTDVNIWTKNYQTLQTTDRKFSDVQMELTVQVVIGGRKVEQTEVVSWKTVLERTTPEDLQNWLTDLMVRDMVARVTKVALEGKTIEKEVLK